MNKYCLIAVLLIYPFLMSIPETLSDPSWVYLKRAENAIEKKDYSTAMTEVRRARLKKINEQLDLYWAEILDKYPEKTNYELLKMKKQKESELKINDEYPQYHYVMGDLYVFTDFLSEAENEYRTALDQKNNLEYPDQVMEIQYKLADLYSKLGKPDLEEMVYREIVESFFAAKTDEYWDRVRYNIRDDITLGHVFKIYRIDGIKYLKALYMLGRREALLQKQNESLFYLSCAAIVWMTYYGQEIKKQIYDFQYENPADFLNYIKADLFNRYSTEDFIIDKIMFYIGYNYFLNREYTIMQHYFELASVYADKAGRGEVTRDLIAYLMKNKDHILTYKELLN